MKKLKLAILLAMTAAGAMAQNFEGSTVEERIAHSTGNNEDSIKTAKGYITMFQQTGANKDWQLYVVIIAGVVLICGTYFILRLLLSRYPRIKERLVQYSQSTNHTNKRWWRRLQYWLDRREKQFE